MGPDDAAGYAAVVDCYIQIPVVHVADCEKRMHGLHSIGIRMRQLPCGFESRTHDDAHESSSFEALQTIPAAIIVSSLPLINKRIDNERRYQLLDTRPTLRTESYLAGLTQRAFNYFSSKVPFRKTLDANVPHTCHRHNVGSNHASKESNARKGCSTL